MNQELDIRRGTVSFWINEGAVQYSDNQIHPLAQISPAGGSIFIVKDDDNKLKAFYVALNIGRVDLEYDVSRLNADKHLVAFTWNLEDRVVLYLDGKPVASSLLAVKVAYNTCMFNVLFPLVLNNYHFHVYSKNNEVFTDISSLNSVKKQWTTEVKANEVVHESELYNFKKDIQKSIFVFDSKSGDDMYTVEIRENNLEVFKNHKKLLDNIQNNTINGSSIGIRIAGGGLAIGATLPYDLVERYSSSLHV